MRHPDDARPDAGCDSQGDAHPVLHHLRAVIGDAAFHSWFRDVSIESIAEDTVTLAVPSKLYQDRIATWYADKLLPCVQREQPGIKRIGFAVRKPSGAAA